MIQHFSLQQFCTFYIYIYVCVCVCVFVIQIIMHVNCREGSCKHLNSSAGKGQQLQFMALKKKVLSKAIIKNL